MEYMLRIHRMGKKHTLKLFMNKKYIILGTSSYMEDCKSWKKKILEYGILEKEKEQVVIVQFCRDIVNGAHYENGEIIWTQHQYEEKKKEDVEMEEEDVDEMEPITPEGPFMSFEKKGKNPIKGDYLHIRYHEYDMIAIYTSNHEGYMCVDIKTGQSYDAEEILSEFPYSFVDVKVEAYKCSL